MRKIYLFIFLLFFVSIHSIAQQNPKIDKKTFFISAEGIDKAKKDLKTAESYYEKGAGTYDEALKYYLKLFLYNPESKELNYKIAVCYLWTSNRKASLTYLLKSSPDVALDYYLLLGRSYQYNLKFTEAKESYDKYMASLTKWQRFDSRKLYKQLMDECDASEVILKEDSLPVFVINLGPVINSYYDDYGAFLPSNDTSIFFTSKRPEKEPIKKTSRDGYKEQILVSNNCINKPSNYAVAIKDLSFSDNTSLAGFDKSKKRIYYYKGRIHNGRLMKADYNHKTQKWKSKMLKGDINHIAYKETSISIADDGTTYYVTDRRGGMGGKDIWVCKRNNDNKYSNPENMGKIINSEFDEEAVHVTPDGNTLYFSSKGRKGMGGFDVYKVIKNQDGTWGEPMNMGYPINSSADDLFYRPTTDSMVSLISSTRDVSYGGLDIYKVQTDPRIPFKLIGSVTDSKTGNTIAATVTIYEGKLQKPIKTTSVDTLAGIYMLSFEDKGEYILQVDYEGYKSVVKEIICPEIKHSSITADFKLEKLKNPFTLVGRISDEDSNKPLQAYVSFQVIGVDSVMGRIISNDSTGNYTITFDDKYDMLMNVQAKDYYAVQEPINTISESASIITKNIKLKRSKIDYNLTGIITQEDKTTPVFAAMSFYLAGSQDPFTIVVSDSLTGKYSCLLDNPGPFLIEVEANGYFFLNETFQFSEGQTLVAKNIVLTKMKTGVKIVIENILFNSGKATLLPSSYKELDKLADLLLTNSNVRIEVSGHTDNVGSAATNKKISKERALTVRNYLVSRGVEEARLEFQGYGFEQPIAPNDTPEGKARNRRVEIKILN